MPVVISPTVWLMSRINTPVAESQNRIPRRNIINGSNATGSKRALAGILPVSNSMYARRIAKLIAAWKRAVVIATNGSSSSGNTIFFTKFCCCVIRLGALPKHSAKRLKIIKPANRIIGYGAVVAGVSIPQRDLNIFENTKENIVNISSGPKIDHITPSSESLYFARISLFAKFPSRLRFARADLIRFNGVQS